MNSRVYKPGDETEINVLKAYWATFQPRALALIKQEALPEQFAETVEQYYLPLALRIAQRHQQLERPILVGINGAQGTGKSTLAVFLQALLSELLRLPCAKFSLDDLYLTKAQRKTLALEVHPLLQTRGVPGTHDVKLGLDVIQALHNGVTGQTVSIPAFDKSTDDRLPESQWPEFKGPAAVVLLEGWCVGAQAQPEQALATPINLLEQKEDPEGVWRRYVNQQLQGDYHRLLEKMDYLAMLKAPSMECVLKWRTLQEQKLAQRIGVHGFGAAGARGAAATETAPSGVMTPEQIERFVQHYERLTRVMLEELPKRANEIFSMNPDHQITGVEIHEP